MKARLIRIGNSRGVRLPKPLLAQSGLSEEVELQVQDGAIIIARSSAPRTGWAEAAKKMQKRGDDKLIDKIVLTRFDKTEWKW
jgi:antitoxin MazE